MAGPSSERIRIRMEGYDHEVLDRTAAEIVKTALDNQAEVHGPIPLPTRIERYTVLRSPHIDRKSREQFEIRTHKRLIDILKPNQKTIEALNKGPQPAAGRGHQDSGDYGLSVPKPLADSDGGEMRKSRCHRRDMRYKE